MMTDSHQADTLNDGTLVTYAGANRSWMMPFDFTLSAGWMKFQSLDHLVHEYGIHTLAWRMTDDGNDPWTRRVNSFKDGDPKALRGAFRVLGKAIPALLEVNAWVPSETGLTVALSHDDTAIVPTKALPRLGAAIASALGLLWCPDVFTKQTHRQLHSIKTGGSDRDAEVGGKYECAPLPGIKRVITLDDITTRGSTLGEMRRAIQAANRNVKTVPVALGKAERKSYAESCGRTISNEHVSDVWQRLWDGS